MCLCTMRESCSECSDPSFFDTSKDKKYYDPLFPIGTKTWFYNGDNATVTEVEYLGYFDGKHLGRANTSIIDVTEKYGSKLFNDETIAKEHHKSLKIKAVNADIKRLKARMALDAKELERLNKNLTSLLAK